MNGKNRNVLGMMSPGRTSEGENPASGGFNRRTQPEEDWENPKVTGRTEEGAAVISGEYTGEGAAGRLEAILTEELETMAKKIQDAGGIIGHVKVSLESSCSTVLSVTDLTVDKRVGDYGPVHVYLAAIVFLLDPETLTDWFREMLERVDSRFA